MLIILAGYNNPVIQYSVLAGAVYLSRKTSTHVHVPIIIHTPLYITGNSVATQNEDVQSIVTGSTQDGVRVTEHKLRHPHIARQ